MKKQQYLNQEEKEIMEAIERDEYRSVTGPELRRMADALAARKKDMTLTIRVNRNDINRIKKWPRSIKSLTKAIFLKSFIELRKWFSCGI
jgi:predicted  nucleic acid-binding Zn-ribbon protein